MTALLDTGFLLAVLDADDEFHRLYGCFIERTSAPIT